jgi:hypothetical protein
MRLNPAEDEMTRRYLSILFLLCLVFMPTLQGHEPRQSTAPTGVVIDGTIVDTAKGVIPGVTVTLAQGNTLLARVVTNSTGTFQFHGESRRIQDPRHHHDGRRRHWHHSRRGDDGGGRDHGDGQGGRWH